MAVAEVSAFKGLGRRGSTGATEYFFAHENAVAGGASTWSLPSLGMSDRGTVTVDSGGSAFLLSLLGTLSVGGASSTSSLLFLWRNDTSGEVKDASMRVMLVGRCWQRKLKSDCGGGDDDFPCAPGAGSLGARTEKRLSAINSC